MPWTRPAAVVVDSQRPWLRPGTVVGERRYQRLLVIGFAAGEIPQIPANLLREGHIRTTEGRFVAVAIVSDEMRQAWDAFDVVKAPVPSTGGFVVLAAILLSCVMLVLGNLLADLLYFKLDPRVTE